jgi:hypothetical protein
LEGVNTTCFVCGEDYESAEHTLFCPNSLAAVYYTPSMLPEASEYIGVGPVEGHKMRSDAEELFTVDDDD